VACIYKTVISVAFIKKKAGRLESHLLWSFYDRSHEKTVYNKPGAHPVLLFLLPH
jgi:hypothetical protein